MRTRRNPPFFKINTQGAALDATEERILRNRRKAPAIVARSVVRASTGHNYWSSFSDVNQSTIQSLAKSVHKSLFAPEVVAPVKSLDLPLGGSASNAQALNLLISLVEIADKSKATIENMADDADGTDTIAKLKHLDKYTQRLVGNNAASLGLHPFVWYYTSQGRHYEPLFLAIFAIISEKDRDGPKSWFQTFTKNRFYIEEILIKHKTIITLLISALGSKSRITGAKSALEFIFAAVERGDVDIDVNVLATHLNLQGRLYTIQGKPGADFSDDAKSSTFLQAALKAALHCPICKGYIDPSKSVSYDHIKRRQDGGDGASDNCQLTHPFCNTGVKS